MSDDKTNRGPADRSRINLEEPYEVEYWSKKFGISPERLRQAVASYGVSADEVEQHLNRD